MGTAAGATFSVAMSTQMTKTFDIVGSKFIPVEKSINDTPVQGSGASSVQKCYHVRLTLAGSGTSDIDLSGALTDVFGDADVMTKLKGYIFHNRSDEQDTPTAANVAITGNFMTSRYGASTSWALDAGDWEAGSYVLTGKTITNTSADTITVTNPSGVQASVDLIFFGV